MNRKVIILLFFFVLASIPAFAAKSYVISNKTYASGSTLTVNGTTYKVTVGSKNSTGSVLTYGNVILAFTLGECMEFYDELLCYVSKTTNAARYTHFDQNADITLEREVRSQDTTNLGAIVGVNISFNNTGRTKAYDVVFTDIIPDGFKVDSIEACDHNGGVVTWTGELGDEEAIECVYYMKAVTPATGTLSGNLTYRTISGSHSLVLDEEEFETILPDWINVTVFPLQAAIGQDINIRLNFTTNETDNLSLERLEIDLKDRFVFKESSYPNLNIRGNIIHLNRNIRKNTSFILDVNVSVIENGSIPLNISITYTTDEDITFVYEYIIESGIQPLKVSIVRDPETTMEPMMKTNFRIYVLNPNLYLDITHYDVRIESPLKGFETGLKKIDVTNSHVNRMVFNSYYTFPAVNETGVTNVSVTVKGYDVLTKEVFGKEIMHLNYVPLGSLEIIKGLNFSTKDGKNIAEVSVFLQSNYARKIKGLKIEENMPGIFFYKGEVSAVMDVEPGMLVEAYSFELYLPFDFRGNEIMQINTTADYTYAGIDLAESEGIPVDQKSLMEFIYPKPAKENVTVNEDLIEGNLSGSGRWWFFAFIIFDVFLVILFVSYFLGFNFIRESRHYLHNLRTSMNERKVVKKNRQLKKNIMDISDKEKSIIEEEKKMEVLIVELENAIEKQNRTAPRKFKKSERKMKKLDKKVERLELIKNDYEERISRIKSKEDKIIQKQEEIQKKRDEIEKGNQEIESRKTQLVREVDGYKDNLIELHGNLMKMKKSRDIVEKNLSSLKNVQLKIIHSKLGKIDSREEELKQKEKALKKEKKKVYKQRHILKKILNIKSASIPEEEDSLEKDTESNKTGE